MASSAPSAAPAWLQASIAPTVTELRNRKHANAPSDAAKKRLRAPVAVDSESRRLHQMIVAQLHHEGFAEAAFSVMRATDCLVPNLADPKSGARLARLVTVGERTERLSAPHPSASSSDGGSAESALFGGSVYTAAAPAEAPTPPAPNAAAAEPAAHAAPAAAPKAAHH